MKAIREEIGPCRVIYANPLPCVVNETTIIDIVDRCDLTIEELKYNILLTLKYSGFEDYLIYPKKTWEKIHTRYLGPLMDGRKPREPGGLLHGPPGTGKTSIIDTIADAVGLYVVPIVSGEVLSPYVGESEEKLKNKLDEAETHEPSLVKLDDAEWLLGKRRGVLDRGGAEVFTTASMLQILLERLPRWKKKGRIIVALVATNVNPETLDPALVRSGRLGREPIFVPLPNYEAVWTLMEKLGVMKYISHEKAEEYCKKLVNLGLNMADVRDVIEQIIENKGQKEPDIEEKESRGYVRPVPSKLYASKEIFDILDKYLTEDMFRSKKFRVYVNLSSTIAEPIIVQYLVNKGIPVILLSDERFVDEAVLTASTSNAVLLVDADLISDEIFKIIHLTSRSPVIFMGSKGGSRIPAYVPMKVVLTHEFITSSVSRMKEVFKLVLQYYNVKMKDEEIDKIVKSTTPTELLRKIETIKFWLSDADVSKLDLARCFL